MTLDPSFRGSLAKMMTAVSALAAPAALPVAGRVGMERGCGPGRGRRLQRTFNKERECPDEGRSHGPATRSST